MTASKCHADSARSGSPVACEGRERNRGWRIRLSNAAFAGKTILFLLLLGGLALPLQARTIEEMKQAGWNLTFHDEFDGTALDTNKWVPHYFFDGVINHELQAYVPSAFSLSDGILHITAKHESAVQHGKTQAYTSGAMVTLGKFSQKYGYFEIRCQLPRGRGFWPAFWLLPDSKEWPPEIDIFENLGHENHKLHFTNHWKGPDGKERGYGQETDGPDYTAGFHTIAVDWEPNRITWYVDDVEQCHVTNHVPQQPMYVLVNLAVGGDWPKSPDPSTPFPSSFNVDYVRVYQHSPTSSPP
jgi:beta-glucanase (GH16 family)